MRPAPTIIRTLALSTAALLLCVCATGCGTIARLSGTSNELSISSGDQSRALTPEFTTAVYMPVDPQTAEVYLTDMPIERLRDQKDTLSDVTGHLVHLHLFLIPKAGETPIDTTACNLTLRHAVLAGPGSGLYSGGGFVQPSGAIGDESIAGAIAGSSHRLVRRAGAFKDALGSGQVVGRFSATRDDESARALAARLDAFARAMKPIEK